MTDRDELFREHAARNLLHSAMLIGGMFVLFAIFGWVLDGLRGVVWLGLLGLLSAFLGARVSPQIVLRMYGARPLSRAQAPGLWRMLDELSAVAGLPSVPTPHYIPSRMINAFAVGSPGRAAIGMTDGLLRTLTAREVRGVVAHEIAHVTANDAWVMGLADFVTRTVNLMSWFGQIMLFVTLPAVLMGLQPPLPLTLLILMIFGPTISALLQLGLSRAREYDADVGAARLSGDPRGLASALAKMERVQAGFFERLLMPGRRVPEPSLLRTHPPTEERVRRLLEMEAELQRVQPPTIPLELPGLPGAPGRAPRWHRTLGSWH